MWNTDPKHNPTMFWKQAVTTHTHTRQIHFFCNHLLICHHQWFTFLDARWAHSIRLGWDIPTWVPTLLGGRGWGLHTLLAVGIGGTYVGIGVVHISPNGGTAGYICWTGVAHKPARWRDCRVHVLDWSGVHTCWMEGLQGTCVGLEWCTHLLDGGTAGYMYWTGVVYTLAGWRDCRVHVLDWSGVHTCWMEGLQGTCVGLEWCTHLLDGGTAGYMCWTGVVYTLAGWRDCRVHVLDWSGVHLLDGGIALC